MLGHHLGRLGGLGLEQLGVGRVVALGRAQPLLGQGQGRARLAELEQGQEGGGGEDQREDGGHDGGVHAPFAIMTR